MELWGGYVKRCYSTGKVTGNGGGLIGYNWQGGVTYDSYWDIQTSGKTSSKGGAGRSISLMMQQATFIGWDFDDIWEIDEGQSYPYFKEPRILEYLEIVGPDEVAEDSQAQYKAMAHYDIGSPKDVTNSADWSVEPNDNCGIAAGLLTTEMVDLPTDIIITAEYSEGDVNETAEKDVSIFAICPSGSALEFDGVDDYVDCGNDGSLDMTDEITISAWVKLSNYNTTDVIVGKNNGNSVTAGYGIFSYTQGFEFNFYSGGNWRRTSPRVPASPNQWHHIAGTYDGNNLYLYIDGEQKASLGYIGTITPAVGHPLNVAYWRSALPEHFDGLIDEVAIYDRALSAEEIQAFMHIRPDTDDPNLVAYWDFDEGSGQVVGDSAGGNDGQLGSTDGIDDNDPNWVDSDAPIGICTMEELFGRNINQALSIKLDILEQLEEALGKETAGQYILEQFLNDGDSNVWKKRDILESKRMVRSAVQNEEKAEINVDQSIDKLDDALDTLGIE